MHLSTTIHNESSKLVFTSTEFRLRKIVNVDSVHNQTRNIIYTGRLDLPDLGVHVRRHYAFCSGEMELLRCVYTSEFVLSTLTSMKTRSGEKAKWFLRLFCLYLVSKFFFLCSSQHQQLLSLKVEFNFTRCLFVTHFWNESVNKEKIQRWPTMGFSSTFSKRSKIDLCGFESWKNTPEIVPDVQCSWVKISISPSIRKISVFMASKTFYASALLLTSDGTVYITTGRRIGRVGRVTWRAPAAKETLKIETWAICATGSYQYSRIY